MRPVRVVLAPVDISEPCDEIVAYAVNEARTRGARLVLLHVVPPTNAYVTPYFVDQRFFDDYYTRAREHARETLRAYTADANRVGVDASMCVEVGPPDEEIIRLADEKEADLIVLGTHGRRGLARVFLGSTAEKVVRLAHCPVLVVKGHAAPEPEAATEHEDASEPKFSTERGIDAGGMHRPRPVP